MSEAIFGYRVWGVHCGKIKPLELKLESYFGLPTIWEVEMESRCWIGDAREHLRKMKCECGIYSYKNLEDLFADYTDGNLLLPNIVAGSIVNYGTVVEHERGYRASHAMINSIFDIGSHCDYCYPRPNRTEFVATVEGSYLHGESFSCFKHLTKMREVIEKVEGIEKYMRIRYEDLLRELARYYEVPLVKPIIEPRWYE